MRHPRDRFWAVLAFLMAVGAASAPHPLRVEFAGADGGPVAVARARPLDKLWVEAAGPGSIEVRDGVGRVYFSAPVNGPVCFQAGGSLGAQHVFLRDSNGAVTGQAGFILEASTGIDDGGKYREMFELFERGMHSDVPEGVESIEWNGRTYRTFVNWVLDNYHTAKGMRYFSPAGTDFVDMMRAAQREDGMIWSNVNLSDAVAYYRTAYGPFGYMRRIGDRYFVRQPAENHPEFMYVSTIYQTWKESGNDGWMGECLPSAIRALDYSLGDPARWSTRFQLLKRVYTIDSWDFQVDDAYTPDIGLTNTMLIDPKKSKFGIFFGDNVCYAASCEELAEMLEARGQGSQATQFRERARQIRERLDALSWNGRFFTHFIDEDPTVRRDLGVDEKTQIAQGNAYALNRGIGLDHSIAILKTYLDLKDHLPPGSPGEWYAIYPPFEKGFGRHDRKWEYMNGGVGGHVAGELARGAFENGYEAYGRDILDRLASLGRKYGNKISFAYTGSIPPPPPGPHLTPLGLGAVANMDLEDRGGAHAAPWMKLAKAGDDIRGLPTGDQQFAGISFRIVDPKANLRRSAVAVSHRDGLPAEVDVPVAAHAGCVYLLHTATKPGSEKVCGSMAFMYDDGTREVQYLLMGKQLTYWWFPELNTPFSGVAWHGPSPVSADVGLSWCAVDNPHPERRISVLRFRAPDDDGIYVLVGATLADRPHYIPPNPVSYGGPDDWAAATAMAAMVEGMAGVKDGPRSETFSHPVVAPRWDLSEGRTIRTTVRYAASEGYVAYIYSYVPADEAIALTLTGSGAAKDCHFLVPRDWSSVGSVDVDGQAAPFAVDRIAGSLYVDLHLEKIGAATIRIDRHGP